MSSNHTFVVLAYGKSQYLPECIDSLMKQTLKSNVVIATSSPNDYIYGLAKQYGLEVIVNEHPSGIAGDFDFGFQAGRTKFVTVAHQDDAYESEYWEKLSKVVGDDTIIAFSDYYEMHDSGKQTENQNLKIKRLLLSPLKCKEWQKSIWMRRRILSMGNPICCPAVTYNRERINEDIFQSSFRSNMDWKAWEHLSKWRGRFVYVPEMLMMHRIHEESTTSEVINEGKRTNEDYEMMRLFWPDFIAKKLSKIYAKSEDNNK